MSNETHAIALTPRQAVAPRSLLTGVQADGHLDGVLFELTLRQTYRNTSDRPYANAD